MKFIVMKDTETKIAECDVEILVPDYETPCTNCGQVPTVTSETTDGVQVIHLESCGPCTWGDASTIDPENW